MESLSGFALAAALLAATPAMSTPSAPPPTLNW